jgi:hypothetical protein
MSRARVDLSGSSSKSSASSKASAGPDKNKMIKIGAAVALLVVAGGYIAWDQGFFESRPTNVAADTPAPAAPENPPPSQPASADAGSDKNYGDDSAAAAAPPKRPERRGGGYINPDAPKDPE